MAVDRFFRGANANGDSNTLKAPGTIDPRAIPALRISLRSITVLGMSGVADLRESFALPSIADAERPLNVPAPFIPAHRSGG